MAKRYEVFQNEVVAYVNGKEYNRRKFSDRGFYHEITRLKNVQAAGTLEVEVMEDITTTALAISQFREDDIEIDMDVRKYEEGCQLTDYELDSNEHKTYKRLSNAERYCENSGYYWYVSNC
ncbi:hypothetical protein PBC5_080 [Bacillus phage PBC5]|nr:hypothetical protein PBC5_080 [Bacillus phage PBC5]